MSCHLAAVPVPWLCKSGANPQPLARGSSISRHPEPSLQLPLLPPCRRCVPQHPLKDPLEPLSMPPDCLVPGTPPVLAHITAVSRWPPTTPLRTRAQKSVTISTSQATQGNSCIPHHSALAPAIPRYLSWRELFLFRLPLRRNKVFFILTCNKEGSIILFFELLSARASVLKCSSIQTCILICICHCYF